MKAMASVAALALGCLLAASALAEPRAHVYGGSGEDFLINIAASGDGRRADGLH